jgi:hypothetical protein
MAAYGKKASSKVEAAMRERKRAIAIGLSEARKTAARNTR